MHQKLYSIIYNCLKFYSKERSFDFEPIQEQVNGNIFGFKIPEANRMRKFVGKTTRGSAVPRNLHAFSMLLEESYSTLEHESSFGEWNTVSLDRLANQTLFKTIFNSVFGEDKESTSFNYELFHKHLQVFHKYFSYLWIGLPHWMFPEATKAVEQLFNQPTPSEFMKSDCTSEYLKAAIEFLQSYNLSDKEIKCHNLVFLHINVNTFKIATWCLYQLMSHKAAMSSVRAEIENLVEANKEMQQSEDNVVTISAKEIENLETLGKKN